MLRIEDTDAARNQPEWIDGIISALACASASARTSLRGPVLPVGRTLRRHSEAARAALPAGPGVLLRLHPGAVSPSAPAPSTWATTASAGTAAWRRVRAGRCGSGTPDEGETVIDGPGARPDRVRELDDRGLRDRPRRRLAGLPAGQRRRRHGRRGSRTCIRSEEHLSNTPKQQLLWEALGREPPVWAHLSVIVNEKRQKLSKRRDKVALEDYRDEGYLRRGDGQLPDAARLGARAMTGRSCRSTRWSPSSGSRT